MQVSLRGRIEIDDQSRGLMTKFLSPQSDFLNALDYGSKPRVLVDVVVFSDNPLAESTFPDQFTLTPAILEDVKNTIKSRIDELPAFQENSQYLKEFNRGIKEIEKGLKFFGTLFIAWNE